MKLSLNWIKEYVALPADLTPEKIAYDLTMTTVEVEGFHDLASTFKDMVVGKITSLSPHPNADRLRIAMTDIGGSVKQIVCGGSNLSVDMLVAVAPPGSRVRWHGEGDLVTLSESKIRGEVSFGMICASCEIGLADVYPASSESEIVDLTSLAVAPGTPLAQALAIDDILIEIDNKSLTNRPDLWGHYGIARELAAIYRLPLAPLASKLSAVDANGSVKIQIDDENLCRRYTATSISGIKPALSPEWLQKRLSSVGQRPINLIVDLTNYVMMATGQPTHAFDARDITGGIIQARRATAGEVLELLDGNKITLGPNNLVIADAQRALALAGIMGGKNSGVRDDTTQIVLEVASFNAGNIRRSATSLGLRTDSSIRFEKGLDTDRVVQAVELFRTLLKQIQPQVEIGATNDTYPAIDGAVSVDVSREFIVKRIGRDFSVAELCEHIERLGFEVTVTGEMLHVRVPSWRATGDVSIPADIVEEVARLYGYDNLEFVAPPVYLTQAIKQPMHEIDKKVREQLVTSAGMVEVFNYPWVDDKNLSATGYEPSAWKLQDPVSPEMAGLVPSLIPNLLATAERNVRYEGEFGLFEVARVFRSGAGAQWNNSAESLPVQPKQIAALLVAKDPQRVFLKLKGALESLFASLPIERVRFVTDGSFSPWSGSGARLALVSGKNQIGELALVSQKSLRKIGISKVAVAAFEFELDKLVPLSATTFSYTPLPKFPEVEFDLAMLFDVAVPWERIRDAAQKADSKVKSVRFIDEYQGEQIPTGKRSVALQMIFADAEKTLTSEETHQIAAKVVAALEKRVGATARAK